MPDSVHAVLSPSSSHIWMNCPPAARMAEKFADDETSYAREGTEAHALAEHKLRLHLGLPSTDPRDGMEFLTEEMENHTDDYVSFIAETLSAIRAKCPDPAVLVEQRLDFSRWVPDGFGYGDCIIVSDGTLHVIDLKYGAGVPVSAEWNSQFLCYALGALDLLDVLYDIRDVTVTAFQPRRENVSTFSLSREALTEWAETRLMPSARLAYDGEGEFHAGEHCRFCKARNICRSRAEHNLELARYDFKPPEELTGLEVSAILGRIDELTSWAKDVSDYALKEALSGREFEGWKVVEGRSVRRYIDEEKAAEAVIALGLDPYEKSILGITAMEKLIGKKLFKEKLGDLVAKAPGKPTLAPLSDKRKAINTAKDDFAPGGAMDTDKDGKTEE